MFFYWGCSSNGRALALHARGTGIDALLLQIMFFFYCKFIMPEKEIIKFLKKQNENKNKKGNEYVFDIQKEIWIKVFIKKEKK